MSAVAVDVGTSMIKTVVFDDEGNEVAVARQATEVRRPRPGWAEQDMDAVWRAVVDTVRAVRPRIDGDVRFLAITAQGDGAWLVDDRGRPTGPAVLWSDGRAADVVERWRHDGVLDRAFHRNGSLTFAGLPNAVLTWFARHDPERLRRSSTLLYCGGWVFSRLTGQLVVDESDASAPFLDPTTRRYDPELLAAFDLEWARPLLPEVRGDDRRVEELTSTAAEELGLPAGLPVVLAPYDIASTALGVGATSNGQACTILGTTLCTEVVRDRVELAGEPAGLTIALDSAGHVLRAYPTLAGTEVLSWVGSLLGADGPGALGDLAAAAEPGARGLVFLPYLSPAGERAPFLDPEARGTWWGLSLEHGRAEVVRAVFEGLTMVIRDCLETSGAATTELRLCGGGANNQSWCQLIADVTGVPAVRSADSEVGAKGAFLCGLVATGAEPDLRRAAEKHVRVRATCEPDSARSALYSELYKDFLAMREISAQGWSRLAAGRRRPGPGLDHGGRS
ncbi:xylulokinase [Streptoalloteichus tenebrarius]|uniref:Xylulokinase n=1 Tax=Streptoalloteichus tenebrarius (strain ATCC 17920 / DSM 40477 / JCM 4838 / CBS 697.72 / NBRC 16177 / NCIMB 11028 / NRRL B-12390 / A12253. 1 / ISP 5477) TaxID=1933 RepID=A0ABT1HWU9_STRSD|nr:FGGY-family carbohydrate kinase [Streptoalloteichus tenebrarius]MCP2260003.1 xylulokinase [Streptoalloteichus tenebrarius]BFF03884.1 FGGY-family carbohydrate kinase [Streptoalloteichus tenebrarius]